VAQLVFGEMANELLLSGARVYPKILLESGYKFLHPDLSQALEHLLKTDTITKE
jgi:NAD dependent epimerase/dehydratase family enzyme